MWMSMIGCTNIYPWKGNRCPSVEPHIFKIQRLAVDSAKGRRDPIRKFPRLHDAPRHQRLYELLVRQARQPFVFALVPDLFRQDVPVHADVVSRKITNGAVKSL